MGDFFDKYINPIKIMESKREYQQQMASVKALPEDYQFVFDKIQHYMWMHAGGDGMDMLKIHYNLIELFEDGAANNKHVLEITGEDVAGFCDELLRNAKTYTEDWRGNLNRDILKKVGRGRDSKMTAIALRVKDLRKTFKGTKGTTTVVLKGVDFEVQHGEIFALLGSNGAGKTTIVNILSTLMKMDGGSASVNGFDVASQPDKVRKSISLTGQFAAVDEILTGKENLVLIAKLRNVSNPEQIADDLLKRFGLEDVADKRATVYSGGMKRRLDIAMSLIGNPSVIFLDEPTTGLDPEGRLEVWKTVKELASNGTTILLTTQYLEEAEQLASRIAILHGGKIIANGTLEELKKLFPPAKVEYVEKQPTLEDIFLSIIDKKEVK